MTVRNHFAILKNLRNIKEAGVSSEHMKKLRRSFLDPSWEKAMTVPIDFIKAQKYMPEFSREIETAMLSSCKGFPKLPGFTIFIVDVSGSMGAPMSGKSEFNRMEAAAAMTVLAAEMCEHISVYATAGSDSYRKHQTAKINPLRGFALSEKILEAQHRLGGGGIFTRQALEYVKEHEKETPDRIVVFSDSQDCDWENSRKPNPFGKYNYIVDVSNHQHGINYKGVWTAEVSSWSEGFLKYIAASEQCLN
ncbi:VWA domain-containing protein [Candidatus Parcubacteria bacterium]|nr:MAG: VWA domain-containing protein [Candidatus Parcubacteria bacterium]